MSTKGTAEARQYLLAHNVEASLKEAIDRVLALRPADPVRAIAEMLNPDLPPQDGYAVQLGAYHQPISTASAAATDIGFPHLFKML